MEHEYIKTFTKYYIACKKCKRFCSATNFGFDEDKYEFDSESGAIGEFEDFFPKSEDLLLLVDKNEDIGFIGSVNENGVPYCFDCWCKMHNLSVHTRMGDICEENYLVSK